MRLTLSTLLFVAICCTSSVAIGQTKELEEKNRSIERMQQRVAQIEKEMDKVGVENASEMGSEFFGLMKEIDDAYMQVKTAYEQQVVRLNQRMQRQWELIESGDTTDREKIDRQLNQLEKSWDRKFDTLTQLHDEHLSELKDSLAKVRGEFSKVAGKAQAQLEASSFEAVARWEKGHEIFLALNRTYVKIAGNQVQWLAEQTAENPQDAKLESRYIASRKRYVTLQENLRQRQSAHLEHLGEELQTRIALLEQTKVWNARRDMFASIDGLYDRIQKTWEHLQTSMLESIDVHRSESKETADRSRKSELDSIVAKLRAKLRKSYLDRALFTNKACVELDERIKGSTNSDEKAAWTAKVTDYRLLAHELERKALRLDRGLLKLSLVR